MNYGLIQDELDPRDFWLDEIMAGEVELPKSHLPKKLPFENQGKWPLCVSASVVRLWRLFKSSKTGIHINLSWLDLFFNSGGTKQGSSFRYNLNRARGYGCHSYEKLPLPEDLSNFERWEQKEKEAHALPVERPEKILGYVRVKNDRDSIKQAILASGAVLVGVYANGGYFNKNAKRAKPNDNHGTVIDGWDEDGNWRIADTLPNKYVKNWDGYHFIDKDYELNSVYAITELPEDYKEIVIEARLDFPNCLNRYGLPMNYMAEVQAENEMIEAFKKNGNPILTAFALRDKKQLINARAYGGYNFQYTKWGIWHAGDLINHEYAKMKTGRGIFNLDEIKK